MGGIIADRAQLGVTALEDFIAQRGTHVGSAIKEGTGELEDTWGETGCKINNRKKVGFYFRNKLCFSLEARRRSVAATSMSALDVCDVLYVHGSSQCLFTLDTVYHGAVRFKTNPKALTYHCSLHAWVGWSTLSKCDLMRWHG